VKKKKKNSKEKAEKLVIDFTTQGISTGTTLREGCKRADG
jgi:hypothetical protein